MNQTISQQAFVLLDNIINLIGESQHLEDSLLQKLEKMESKMNFFIIEFHKHLALSKAEYSSYLNHDALSQLTFILGYAELFRSVNANLLNATAVSLLDSICTDTRALTESLRAERDIMLSQRNQLTHS